MHERRLMAELMAKILETAAGAGARRVVGIRVWLGALSHMTPEHFREHFAEVAAGTIAEGARVEAELDDDPTDPRAQGIVLLDVEVV